MSPRTLGFGASPLIQQSVIEVGGLSFVLPCPTSSSQTPTGQYAPNGIQPNLGAFQPQLGAYSPQAQESPQWTGLVQAQRVQQFVSAAPLGVLSSGAAVVDCPRCNVRGVTRTSYVAGNTTQYV